MPARRLAVQLPIQRSAEGKLRLRWPLSRTAGNPKRVSVRLGGSLRVGIDTTNDGRIDTVLEAPRQHPFLQRVLFRLIGWLPFTRLARWCVRQGLRWLALRATPAQLYASLQICTGGAPRLP